MHHINALLTFITHHPEAAYIAVFFISFFESLALIGLALPGTMIMFGLGAIVATGSLGLKPALLLAITGAISGDGISFWIGHHYQQRLNQMWPLSRYPALLKNGVTFFHRHGGKSVLFGRFIGPLRPVIPMVAGMVRMRPLYFIGVNVLSVIAWAFAYILPGVFFGTSLMMAGAVSTRLAVLLLLTVAISWGFAWLVRKLIFLVRIKGPSWISDLKSWAFQDAPAYGALGPLKIFFSRLFRNHHGEIYIFGASIAALFLAGWGFLGLLQRIIGKDPLELVDISIYHLFQAIRSPRADYLFVALTETGDYFVNLFVAGAVLGVLLVKRCYRTAFFWAMAVVGGFEGIQLLKWAIHLPRPTMLYDGPSAFAFPSGHTTMSVILYGFLAFLLTRGVHSPFRRGLFAITFTYCTLIAISRLYLGAHWLSDIMGGFFIGTAWASLLGIAYLKKPAEGIPRHMIGVVAVLAILIAGGWHISQKHTEDLRFYAFKPDIQPMSFDTWLSSGWRQIPGRRTDMSGEQEQPLSLQWAGSTDELEHYLLSQGWRRPPALGLKTFMGMLSPETPLEKLPVLPSSNSGRFDALRLVSPDKNERWVLRLWPTGFRVGAVPLMVGAIEIQTRHQLTWLFTAAMDTGEYKRPLDALAQQLRARFSETSVSRENGVMTILLIWPESLSATAQVR